MSELKFKIKTEADLKALQATKSGLEEAAKATKALGKDTSGLEAEIKRVDAALTGEAANAVRAAEGLKKAIDATKKSGGDTGPLKQQLAGLQSQYGLPTGNPLMDAAGKLPGGVGNLVTQLAEGGVTTGIAAAAAGFAALAKGVDEFAQAEQRATALDAALAQSGQLTDQYREHLQELAGQLQETTGVADDKWFSVLTRLTQFGSKPESIGMDVEAVKNLAGLLGGDIVQAAEAYSRALQGNYEIFSRYGIKVDEAGTQTEKLAKLQEQLALRGGGQLEASNRTLIGQYQQFKNSLGDFFEAIGRWISQTGLLQYTLYGLGKTLAWLAQLMGGFVPQVEGLKNVLQTTVPAAGEAEKALKSYGDEVKAQTALSEAFERILKREVAAILAKQRALDEITDAQMAVKLSGVDAQEKTGTISAAEATRRRAEIRANAENERYHNAIAAQSEIIKNAEAAKERPKQAIADAAKAVEEAEASKVRVAARDAAVGQGHILNDHEINYWKTQKGALEQMQNNDLFKGQGLSLPDLGIDIKEGAWNKEKEAAVNNALAQIEKMLRRGRRPMTPEEVKATEQATMQPDDAANATTLEAKLDALKDAITKGEAALSQQQEVINQAQSTINQLTTKKFITDPTGRFQTAQAIQEAQTKQVAEPLPAGSKVTDQMAQEYQRIATANVRLKELIAKQGEFIAARGYADEQQLKIIADGQRNLEAMMKRMEQLQTRMNVTRP